MSTVNNNSPDLIDMPLPVEEKKVKVSVELPANLGKAWSDCDVPDFNDPERPKTCLEVDFPIAQINALSQLEGNAGKPIYQMSKWWARRRSSVFRSMLIAAATKCPDDPSEAAKVVWDHYYCNHQKAGKFSNLKVLEPFMGGGTTLVEGARLGMQMTGIDLNPVAWFVCKNELAGSDPKQVEALFAEIEKEVKPQIQPFYTTTCPRGHKGKWIDVRTNLAADIDPITLPPEDRKNYRWEGPEVIYTFWAKHGPCGAHGCDHRTPLFKRLVVAQKTMSTTYLELTCPDCGEKFHAELGESRMAPGAEFICTDDETFTTTSQKFANLLNDYDKGTAQDTIDRWTELTAITGNEAGLKCPHCHAFAGQFVQEVLREHTTCKSSDRKKKAFKIQKKKVQLWLLISPEWVKGVAGADANGQEYGGYAGADVEITKSWNEKRLENLSLIEVRAKKEPDVFFYKGEKYSTTGTMPANGQFSCNHCGKEQKLVNAVQNTEHTAPAAMYALQCHCPECEKEQYNYSGRYFKTPDEEDIRKENLAEFEWSLRSRNDLEVFWPQMEIPYSMRTHVKDPLPLHGYTHWWKMFSSKQLIIHAQLLKFITESAEKYPLDVVEQVLGAFQQYLRNLNMFCFWDTGYDKLVPMMSNANYNPKNNTIGNSVFHKLGRGNFTSTKQNTMDGVLWCKIPWEAYITNQESLHLPTEDPLLHNSIPYCGSSSDLSMLHEEKFDLVITDPPFGDNLYYADMADFFYVWLRIPMLKWYAGQPEAEYFRAERTPHSAEAIDNEVEHPDDREEYEKEQFITRKNLAKICELMGDNSFVEKQENPLFRPRPAGEFYSQTLAACWSEAGRHLKPGGIMAFTFHHNDDNAWIDVLKALFEAGYYLIATYPIRSDETKGDNAAFGSKKIEYDVIHVCRKRLSDPEPVSYAKMRKFVREEAGRLKALLETVHGKELPEADLRVILRGKSLEFYSQHYGQVQTGTGEMLGVRDALLGINQMLDDILEDAAAGGGLRPPESAEPISRLYLRVFKNIQQTTRDNLHKTLQGSGISQNDLESRGWIKVHGREVDVVSIADRYAMLTKRGLTRKHIKTDLDQTFFLMGMVLTRKNLINELETGNLKLKKSVQDILKWFHQTSEDPITRQAASSVITLMAQFEQDQKAKATVQEQPSLFDFMDEEM